MKKITFGKIKEQLKGIFHDLPKQKKRSIVAGNPYDGSWVALWQGEKL